MQAVRRSEAMAVGIFLGGTLLANWASGRAPAPVRPAPAGQVRAAPSGPRRFDGGPTVSVPPATDTASRQAPTASSGRGAQTAASAVTTAAGDGPPRRPTARTMSFIETTP